MQSKIQAETFVELKRQFHEAANLVFSQKEKSPDNTKLCDAYGTMAMWFNKAALLPKALGSVDKLTSDERRE